MIHPQMATMLAYVVTDAAISTSMLRRALTTAVRGTFNSITVDGDTSTNDTLMVLASGEAGNPAVGAPGADYNRFVAALEQVCHSLALQIVSDGEGASHVIEIEVRGASSDSAAEQVARTIAGSPLVKTMFAGADPNWGRVLAAAGRAGVKFDPHKTNIYLGGILTCRRGVEQPFDEARRAQPPAAELRSRGCGPGRRRRKGAGVDVRFHHRLRTHQCKLSDLTTAACL